MFIRISLKLEMLGDDDYEDEKLKHLTSTPIGYKDSLLNLKHVESFYPSVEHEGTIVELSSGKTLNVKESINEIHERINRAHFLPLLQ